jgi:hypothetical protein
MKMSENTQVEQATPTPVVKKPSFISTILSNFWSKLQEVDTKINSFVSKISNGHSVVFMVVAAVVYWYTRPFFSLVVSIPAKITEIILQSLSVIIPVIISAVPYAFLVGLGLLLIVEVVNAVKGK